MRKLVWIVLAATMVAGCSKAAEKPKAAAPAEVHHASHDTIKVNIDPKDPETQSYETENKNIAPNPGAGMVYSKVAPRKVMTGGKAFNIYTEAKAADNHFIPSGWMGDYGDIKINDKYSENPHSGSSCIQIIYSNKATQGARWAGIYWQNPANNWGTRPGGYDLTGATKLTFWARGDKGGERIEEFKIGGISGEFGDTDAAGIGPVTLTQDWQQYTIDLDGKDLTSISGGFCWATNLDVNPEGATFYLDDIKYE